MKLIIEIPKEFYETIKTTLSYRFNYLEEKVRQATPLEEELEEIKAEINICQGVLCDIEKVGGITLEKRNASILYKQDVIRILDNHIKELNNEIL